MTTLTKPVAPDRSKIDMHNSIQVRAWAKKLNVSPAELQKIVETVGNSAAEVKKELGRSGSEAPPRPDERTGPLQGTT